MCEGRVFSPVDLRYRGWHTRRSGTYSRCLSLGLLGGGFENALDVFSQMILRQSTELEFWMFVQYEMGKAGEMGFWVWLWL